MVFLRPVKPETQSFHKTHVEIQDELHCFAKDSWCKAKHVPPLPPVQFESGFETDQTSLTSTLNGTGLISS